MWCWFEPGPVKVGRFALDLPRHRRGLSQLMRSVGKQSRPLVLAAETYDSNITMGLTLGTLEQLRTTTGGAVQKNAGGEPSLDIIASTAPNRAEVRKAIAPFAPRR